MPGWNDAVMANRNGTTLRRRLLWPCIVAGLIAIAGLLALGLPGVLVLEAAMPVVHLITSCDLGSDQAWPIAIGISIVGPFALVPAYLAMAGVTPSRSARLLGTMAISFVADMLGSVVAVLLAVA